MRAELLPKLIALANEEFVIRRGRAIGVEQRFPGLLTGDNLERLHAIESGEELASGVAVKDFDWHVGGRTVRGSMLGLVVTAPSHRGRGMATRVVEEAWTASTHRGREFMVLFTSQPEFYARSGWQLSDSGVFAEVATSTAPGVTGTPVANAFERLQSTRDRWLAERVDRSARDWLMLPMPATSVEVFEFEEAYALVGRSRSTGYVYELVGDAKCFAGVWQQVRAAFGQIFINDRLTSPSQIWLAETGISFMPRPLSMWRTVSPSLLSECGSWYLSWFDRI